MKKRCGASAKHLTPSRSSFCQADENDLVRLRVNHTQCRALEAGMNGRLARHCGLPKMLETPAKLPG